jgi:hypothetical protein
MIMLLINVCADRSFEKKGQFDDGKDCMVLCIRSTIVAPVQGHYRGLGACFYQLSLAEVYVALDHRSALTFSTICAKFHMSTVYITCCAIDFRCTSIDVASL